jgi:hypothetical protein
MSSKIKIQLVLRSADINGTAYATTTPFAPVEPSSNDITNSKGFINRWQSSMRWDNINLRSFLGPIYKEGGTYNLKLESICFGLSSNLSTYTNVEHNKAFNIIISGFPFIKSYSSNLTTNYDSLLASVRLPNGAQQNIFNYNSNELTFSLTNNVGIENANISIQFKDLLTNQVEPNNGALTVAYPHSQYVFSIYSVD